MKVSAVLVLYVFPVVGVSALKLPAKLLRAKIALINYDMSAAVLRKALRRQLFKLVWICSRYKSKNMPLNIPRDLRKS